MSSPINKPVLPANPTLKDINKYKKQLNWGELPAFYHMIASSVSELESVQSLGFDNALKRVLNRHNWNLNLLDGYVDEENRVHVQSKPRISVYQIFTDRGFELHCFPYAKNKEVDQYIREHRLMEFVVWDPGTMKVLCRVNQLHKFIDFYFQRGDKADRALIFYAMKLIDDLIAHLKLELDIVKVDGITIRQYFDKQEKTADGDLDDFALTGLKGNILSDGNSN